MIFDTITALLMVKMASPVPQGTIMGNRVMETLFVVMYGVAVTVAMELADVE